MSTELKIILLLKKKDTITKRKGKLSVMTVAVIFLKKLKLKKFPIFKKAKIRNDKSSLITLSCTQYMI